MTVIQPRLDTKRAWCFAYSPVTCTTMKCVAGVSRRKAKGTPSESLLATSILKRIITFHINPSDPESEARHVPSLTKCLPPRPNDCEPALDPLDDTALPFLNVVATEEAAGSIPAYEATEATKESSEKLAKVRQSVAHMDELKAQEAVFLQILLSLHHHSQLLTPCRAVVSAVLAQQTPHDAHALGSDLERRGPFFFFEKHNYCRVLKNTVVNLGHHGERCPDADPSRGFTLVESNGIHATSIRFCRCRTVDGQRGAPEFQQLLRAGIFPGSIKEPKTGYTLRLLEQFHEHRSQGKGSAYNFVLVLQRLADPWFASSVPDIYANFLVITRFHQHLDIIMRRGHAHSLDVPLLGETDRLYPNRPVGYLGLQCAACPERGVNMPLIVNVPRYLRHLISQHFTLDGNFKANLFYKRDNGSDKALTDGKMYFPKQDEFDHIAKTYVVEAEDTEPPCNGHIGSIRHQGLPKYGNTAVSGVIACSCDHAVLGSLVDMLKGEAFALGTFAHVLHLRHTNSPPHGSESMTPTVFSYDSWCSYIVNLLKRIFKMFPDDKWLKTLLTAVDGAVDGHIPAGHIPGHGHLCHIIFQAIYFACRAHFHGETAEVQWAFLNPLGSSTRQMTGAARHDIINFVMDAWNTWKVLRQAKLLTDERLDTLTLFKMHMAVVEDLSRQHATEVVEWSKLPRKAAKDKTSGKWESVYQHKSTSGLVLTIENVLASMIAEERQNLAREDGYEATMSVAKWIHDGMTIERQQYLMIALLKSQREHPLTETLATITKLRESLNADLKKFREHQRDIYPRLKLSALDADEPELTALQLPSYRMKHGQHVNEDSHLRDAEIQLRCTAADNGVLAVRAASLALSAVKKAREQDYRGQAGVTCMQRNLQKAELTKTFEITMYNKARDALVYLGHIAKDADDVYPPLTHRDTRRKETHLHRATEDSRLFDGRAWHLQSGVTISGAAVDSRLAPNHGNGDSDEEEPQLLAGTQTLKRSASEAEDSDSDLEVSPSKRGAKRRTKERAKRKAKRSDGWIWLEKVTRGQKLGDTEKLAEYKRESDRVQWFRAEAEMYRWLEQYEHKHAELMRVMERYRRDGVVWAKLAAREVRQSGSPNGD
ncbi:hypothetical protein B0H12DRAFT_1080327 [Mycena haematopus]|nr:hypothetical protein B0H12DRAFT_1080327 [Mycena haematopus]